MKHRAFLFAMVLGLVLSMQPVQAEDLPVTESDGTVLEDVTSEGLVEEELPLLEDDEEGPVIEEGEEGEVTERGVRRFKLKPRKRITLPKTPRRSITKPQTKRRRIIIPKSQTNKPRIPIRRPSGGNPPQTGGTKSPFVENGGGQGQPGTTQVPQCVIKTSDIVDPRIENGDTGDGDTTKGAQGSLMRVMQNGSVEERRAASSIIMAIKAGQLAGVHAPDLARKASADRAASIPPVGTKGYWDLLAPGQVGQCLREPVGAPPMLLYRQKNMPPGAVEHALVTNWAQCSLPTLTTPCQYVVDAVKPIKIAEETPEESGDSTLIVSVVWADGGQKYPASNATIRLQGPTSGAVSAPLGQATFRRLPPGEYNVTGSGIADGAMLTTGSEVVELVPGETTAVQIWLDTPDEAKACDPTFQLRMDRPCEEAKVEGEDLCILHQAQRNKMNSPNVGQLTTDLQHATCVLEVHNKYDRCKLESAKLSNCPVTVP